MSNQNTYLPHIKNYHPLDIDGDAIWIPIPHGSSEIFDLGYDVKSALIAWGVRPVCDRFGKQIMHPDHSMVGKFLLPEKWSVRNNWGPEWSVRDENNRHRIWIRYEAHDADYIVASQLTIPFDTQTKTSKDEVPPKEWWIEVYHHGLMVYKSDSIFPYTEEVLYARENMPEVEYFSTVFLPQLRKLEQPLQIAAKQFFIDSYPLFPTDLTAYW